MLTRRQFLLTASAVPFLQSTEQIITVNGAIRPQQMGKTLIHEHLLVDFIGADKISPDRWNREEVLKTVLPYLLEVKK